jgi:hypothetical protein
MDTFMSCRLDMKVSDTFRDCPTVKRVLGVLARVDAADRGMWRRQSIRADGRPSRAR